MLNKRLLILLAVVAIPIYGYAVIYKQQDGSGGTLYSDAPIGNNATPVKVPSAASISTSQQPPANPVSETSIPTTAPSPHYDKFSFVSPKDQETFQNQPVIAVELGVDPTLQENNLIQLFLDGKPYGKPSATVYFNLSEVERGEHKLSAVILDANQQVIKISNSITIYVHKNSPVTSPTGPRL